MLDEYSVLAQFRNATSAARIAGAFMACGGILGRNVATEPYLVRIIPAL